ncbi:MAG: hypothetical protein ND866_12265 [Pyrinomonadaceae bacterium]|nr:hypothetical protein [Pyrinomonadaceae bacterium]
MLKKSADFIFTIKVVLGAAAALLVLASWLVHPAMSGEMREAGRWLVWLLMIGVGVAALFALILGRNSRSKSGRS